MKPKAVSQFDINESVSQSSSKMKSVRDTPAWVISLVAHVAVLLLLASMTRITIFETQTDILSSIEELDPDEYKFDSTVVDQIGSDSDANKLSLSQQAATQVGNEPQKQTEQKLEEEFLTVEIPNNAEIIEPSEAEILEVVETSGATEHAGGVEGAIDRLSLEIAGSLKENKTLVIWLFDVSPSVSKRRDVIADRFENVYKQLGLLKVQPEKYLKTAVASFGAKTNILTPDPVDDIQSIVGAIREIEADKSGDENVFSAVLTVAKRWSSYRTKQRRNMMIIVVTDEAGTDQNGLEAALSFTKRYGMKCYVVGNAAPFGRRIVKMPWELPNGDIVTAVAEQGPETVVPERLQLPFWGLPSGDLDNMSSAFGPYALTRLCAETNGLYFVAADTPGKTYDPAVMRNYRPDYSPVRRYEMEARKDPTKSALLNTALISWQSNMPTPQLTFPASTDNELRQVITEAQKPVALLDGKLQELYASLIVGEKNRPNLRNLRWRASFDLAMGRVLAMRVRAYGYNTVLAEMKATPKTYEKKDSNMWLLKGNPEITSGPAVKKLAKKARGYLSRVVDNHPGTPWADLAERELSKPMGWVWEEGSMLTAKQIEEMRKNNPQFDEEQRKQERRRRNLAKPPIKI